MTGASGTLISVKKLDSVFGAEALYQGNARATACRSARRLTERAWFG